MKSIDMDGYNFALIIISIIIILVIYFVFVQKDEGESFTQQQKESIAKGVMKNKELFDDSKKKYTDLKTLIPIIDAPTYDRIYNLYRDDNLTEENIVSTI